MTRPRESEVRRVALTGGIAAGKSYCLDKFAALGMPTIDADTLAHEAVVPGSPALAAVVARFGDGILDESGALDRPALGRVVFGNAAARRDLEAIIHPVVYDAIRQWFEALPDQVVGIADVPLLYETGRAGDFDRVIAVTCTPLVQLARLMSRDGLARDEARRRIAAQLPIGEKAAKADFVIDTSGTFDETNRQIADVFWRLRRR